MSNSPQGEERLTIKANSNVSRGKFAAAAVHAALNHYGFDHGAVIVLGAKPSEIEAECVDVVHDAGRTEVDPGTVTAGVWAHTDAPGELPSAKKRSRMERLADDLRAQNRLNSDVEAIMAVVKKHVR